MWQSFWLLGNAIVVVCLDINVNMDKNENRAVIKLFQFKRFNSKSDFSWHERCFMRRCSFTNSYHPQLNFNEGDYRLKTSWMSRWDMHRRQPSTCPGGHGIIERRLNVRYVADCLKISYDYRRTGLSQGLRSMGATNVDTWKQTSPSDNFSWKSQLYSADPAKFLCRYVTTDETWAHHFDPRPSYKVKHGNIPPHRRQSNSARLPLSAKLWHVFCDSECVLMTDYLEKEKTVTGSYYAELIRKLHTAIQEKRSCAASSQRTSPHFCCCYSCYSRLQLRTAESPAIFSRPGSIWLPCVPIFERFATWTDIRQRWNCHSGYKWLVWTVRWKFFDDGVKALGCWWGKCTALEVDNVEKL